MNLHLPRMPGKATRDATAAVMVSVLGVVAIAAVYATWRFAKLVP